MTTKKILKITVGSVFIDGKSHNVTLDAWEKKSKDGKMYFEARLPIFVNNVDVKEEKSNGTDESW